jgi:hypothetical protein
MVLLALAAPALLSPLVFKAELVFPSLSAISLGIAGMVALLAYATASKRDCAHVTLWDVSGLYILLGSAAAMLSDPQHVVEFWSLSTGDQGAAR